MKEALFYELQKDRKVRCQICPHHCLIAPDKTGICRQRKNIDGKLYLINYARVTSIHMDPVEKKPLYHFYPAQATLSLGTNGCNLACLFCQNWTISQEDAETDELPPPEAVTLARKQQSFAISYTYNEPLMWYEYVLDTAQLARQAGLKNILVTNGYINPEPLNQLLPYIDALNIDIKSIEDGFYRKLCKAKVNPVLETAKIARKTALVEITNLVIPGENDTEDNFKNLSEWVAKNIGRDTPLHFSAYFPTYKLTNPPTPVDTLLKAYQIGKQYLDHVYVGNVSLQETSDTFCHKCRTKLIQRLGYNIKILKLTKNGRCGQCGAENNIIMSR